MKKVFKQLFILLCLLAAPLCVNAQTLVFHLAGGKKTTVPLPATFTVTPTGDKLIIAIDGSNDVELLKDDIMCVTYRDAKGDVNGDQRVDVADVSTIVGLLIGVTPSSDHAPEGAVAVDLSLPSGTKWANMNVGATAEEEYGLFFAWGETVGYSSSSTDDGRKFDWASYKWMTEGKSLWEWINKYQSDDGKTNTCWYSNGTFVGDGQTVLFPEDDAAHANWGGDWYMPTNADFAELLNNTTSEWITLKGVEGCKFTSKKNGNAIFLPAAGHRNSLSLYSQGMSGEYWSSSLGTMNTYYARSLYSISGSADSDYGGRCSGLSVRPVLRK